MPRHFSSLRMVCPVVLLIGFSLAGSGGRIAAAHADDMHGMDMGGTPAGHHDHAVATRFGQPADGKQAGRTVEVSVGDTSFTPAHLEVKQGEVVRFVVKNVSSIDHEFALGDRASQTAHRKEMAAAMLAGHPAHQHPGSGVLVLAAGASGELAWLFSKAGDFEYDCNIPGHYESGMAGTISVKP